jgi:hypothetical protein
MKEKIGIYVYVYYTNIYISYESEYVPWTMDTKMEELLTYYYVKILTGNA